MLTHQKCKLGIVFYNSQKNEFRNLLRCIPLDNINKPIGYYLYCI